MLDRLKSQLTYANVTATLAEPMTLRVRVR